MARDATPLLELGRKAKATENRSSVPQRMPFSQCPSPKIFWATNRPGG